MVAEGEEEEETGEELAAAQVLVTVESNFKIRVT